MLKVLDELVPIENPAVTREGSRSSNGIRPYRIRRGQNRRRGRDFREVRNRLP